MKVRRKQAKPYNGEPMPFKLALAISRGEARIPKPSEAEPPWCECTRWMRHGDHSHVQKISDTHGMVKNCAGHLSVVAPGEHIVLDPEGRLIHHPLQDISKWYEIK